MANVVTITRPEVVSLIEEAAQRLTGGNKTEAVALAIWRLLDQNARTGSLFGRAPLTRAGSHARGNDNVPAQKPCHYIVQDSVIAIIPLPTPRGAAKSVLLSSLLWQILDCRRLVLER